MIIPLSSHLINDITLAQVNKIFITPDLTPLEQKRNKKLREELANLNKDGRKFIIKNGREAPKPYSLH